MRNLSIFVLLLFSPIARAQLVGCQAFRSDLGHKIIANNIPYAKAITKYMTAVELSESSKRALRCEFPPADTLREIDTAIAWRVLKFARSEGEQMNQKFIAFCASSRQDALTADIAVKWLVHNNLIPRFNTWDAADVRHNWAMLPKQAEPASPPD